LYALFFHYILTHAYALVKKKARKTLFFSLLTAPSRHFSQKYTQKTPHFLDFFFKV